MGYWPVALSWLQFRFPFLLACIWLTMAHLIEDCRFSSFSIQTCMDNSVSCLYFSLRKDFRWFVYLVLKSLGVTAMHVCPALLSVDETLSLKTTFTLFVKLFLSSVRQFSLCQQLQSLSSYLPNLSQFSLLECFWEWCYCACLKKTCVVSATLAKTQGMSVQNIKFFTPWQT